MCADSVAALPALVSRAISDARVFYGHLEVFFSAPGCSTNNTNSEREMELGTIARRLASDLQSLEGADLPAQIELGLNTFRPLFHSFIERWNWDRVIGPDGDAFLAEQLALREAKRRSYFSAVRSHVKAHAMGRISKRPSDGYFYDAKAAERESIPPCEPFVASEEELVRIFRAWIFSPYLGPEFPNRTPEEFTNLARAVQDMADGIRGTPWEAAGDEKCDSNAGPEPASPAPSSKNPEVIQAPGGFSFTYSPTTLPTSQEPEDVSNRPEWIAWADELQRNEKRMADARRVDPMPDPEKISVGEMIDFITFVARTPQAWLAIPEIGQQYIRRNSVLSASPGWKAFQEWRDIEHHRKTPLEAANELLALLVDRQRRKSDELRLMPLLEAVRLLSQPAAASPPTPTRENERADAAPASGTETPAANPSKAPEGKLDAAVASWTEAADKKQTRAGARGNAEITERRVAEKLRDSPRGTSEKIAKAIGEISAGRVRNTRAWKEHQGRLKKEYQQTSVETVPLTRAMLAVRDSGARDPAEIAAELEESARQEQSRVDNPEAIEPIEVLKRRYLEGANSDQKARFHKLNPTDQELEVTAWKLTGMRGE
jgi:hypothetical protein